MKYRGWTIYHTGREWGAHKVLGKHKRYLFSTSEAGLKKKIDRYMKGK